MVHLNVNCEMHNVLWFIYLNVSYPKVPGKMSDSCVLVHSVWSNTTICWA